jgi:hypothetical protein
MKREFNHMCIRAKNLEELSWISIAFRIHVIEANYNKILRIIVNTWGPGGQMGHSSIGCGADVATALLNWINNWNKNLVK